MGALQKCKQLDIQDIESLARYISEIIAKESGNVLEDNQQSMVISRLKKRLLDLGDVTPNQYYKHLNSNYKKELKHLISILTTHHTFFFREYCHFEYIQKNLESIISKIKKRGESKIKIYSAACSRGQEAYSLAMFFDYHLKQYPEISYEIFGTDIDPESVKVAKNGVYPYKEVKGIPQIYLTGNWQRGTGNISHFAKVKSHIKDKCNFDSANLLSQTATLSGKKFDIIFCRNVFIYFDSDSITSITNNLKNYLHKGGLFITGLSESLKSIDIKKNTLAPSVYNFDEMVTEKEAATDKVQEYTKQVVPAQSLIPSPIKVVAVDDSSSVLKLLSKIFNSDPEFELVGTAKNGKEAEEFLKKNKVDAMTLDIHMPEMDGVEYLKKNFKKGHPNVVVISSASREDTRYAQETLKYGACDFVEKPALNNLSERAEEIKIKLKMSFLNQSVNSSSSLDTSFKKDYKISNIEKKARLFFGSYSDIQKISNTLKELKGDQPPTLLFFEGNGNFLEIIKEKLNQEKVEIYQSDTKIKANTIYICDFKEHFENVSKTINSMKVSISIFGISSKKVSDKVIDINNSQLLLEDLPNINKDLKEIASDIFPWTSFAHLGTEFLSGD